MISLNWWKKNRNLTYELVRKSVKTQYRNSVLGVVWTVLNPLLNSLVMWLVFSQIFGKNNPLYSVYLLTGNILFGFLRAGTSTSLFSIVGNRGLLTKVKIDPYLFPLSATLSSLVNMFFSTVALLVIMFFLQVCNATGGAMLFSWNMLLVLLMMPAMLLFEYGISLFLSALYVFLRDIKNLYAVFLTLWQYLTPVFYNENIFSSSSFAGKVVKLNPMYHFLTYFRQCMYLGSPNWKTLGFLYLFGAISILVGYAVYKPLQKHFITNI